MFPLALIAAPLLLAAYYATLILRLPRPPAGAIAVNYEPPGGLSPAALRYIWRNCVDERTIACVLAGLATKGRIAMKHTHGSYKITKLQPAASAPLLNDEEQSTMEWLFSNFFEEKVFDPRSSAQGCIMSLRGLLDRNLRGRYWTSHSGNIALGIFVSFIAALALAWMDKPTSVGLSAMLFMSVLLAGFTIAVTLIPASLDLVRGIGKLGRLVFSLAISAMTIAGVAGLIQQLLKISSSGLSIAICLLAAINIVAIPLLRSITPLGIETKREIEGFREYLVKVEQDPLNRMLQPNAPPPASATLLSYAIALEVKEAWGDDLVNACFPG